MLFIKKFLCVFVITFTIQNFDVIVASPREGESSDVQVQVVLPESLMAKLEGFEFVLDGYKNIVVSLKSPSTKDTDRLKEITDEMALSYKNYGIYVQIPIEHGEFAGKLEKLGFKLYELDTNAKTLSYLFANGRNIPELNYAYTAAAAFLIRTNPETFEKELLVVNEPQKVTANIIGGISAKGESPEDTVAREVREEVSIDINKQKLKLVAVFHTVRSDKKSCIEFIYICDEFKGVPKVDNVEVTEYAWVPLSQILKEEETTVFGKCFFSLWKKVLRGAFKDHKNGADITKTRRAYQVFNTVD